ncbi:MAG: PAS domain-containing sensor histidine kinase [Prevotella sp.]|nr:PAS domain-containing sensor histidine kinase [Prevotella sp.]
MRTTAFITVCHLSLNVHAFSDSGTNSISVIQALIVLAICLVGWGINRYFILRINKTQKQIKDASTIIEYTLNLRNSYVLRLDLKKRIGVNLHGNLLPPEGMSYEDSLNFIHPDDVQHYVSSMRRLLNGEVETDECFFRWDMSGERHNHQWRYMHDLGVIEYTASDQQLPSFLYCTLTDQTDQVEREMQTAELTEKYKKVYEQSLVGLAFYDSQGHLLNTNSKMREIMHFKSEEDLYYYQESLFDMPLFLNIFDHRHIEEMYFCTLGVIPERDVNTYLEVRVHPILDNNKELKYVTISIRDINQERELYLKNRKNEEGLRKASETIQLYESELLYLMDTCDMRFWRIFFKQQCITFYRRLSEPEKTMSFSEFAEQFVDKNFPLSNLLMPAKGNIPQPATYLVHTRAIFHETDELHWNVFDTVPSFDENGFQTGFYGVIRNVTPLINKQEQLRQETERANDSGRMKSVFMANMTHEIRTPLNSIVGFSDVLPMLQTPEEKKEIIRVIMNNCDMLMRLISDILSLSTIDNEGMKIEPKPTDFSNDFNDICKILAERVQNPNVEFQQENPCDVLPCTIDKRRIQQVITNFVTNAVKYTHEGHIRVGYRTERRQVKGEEREANGIYVYCEDTGAGIPEESQAMVFDRFVKLNDYVQGTGLGLSISKSIVDNCKGYIGVVSEGDGKGSTFWFWIPTEEAKNTDNTEKSTENETEN